MIVLDERILLKISDKDMADILQREIKGMNTTILGVTSTIDDAVMLLKTVSKITFKNKSKNFFYFLILSRKMYSV